MSETKKQFFIDKGAIRVNGLTGEVTHYSAEEVRTARSERTDKPIFQIPRARDSRQ